MRKEIFRCMEIEYVKEKRKLLNGLNLCVLEGESFGVFCMSKSTRDAIKMLLQGELSPFSGSVFICGRPKGQAGNPGEYKVVRLTEDNAMLGTCTLWENLLVIRKHNHRAFLLNPWLLRKHAQLLLDEYGIPVRAETMLQELSLVQRYMIEILKAFVRGAKIILLDEFPTAFTLAEYRTARRLMLQIQQMGGSFVILSNRREALEITTNRLALVDAGRVLHTFDSRSEGYGEIGRLWKSFFSPPPIEWKGTREDRQMLCRLRLKRMSGQEAAISLYRSEIAIIVDRSSDVLQVLYETEDFAGESFAVDFQDGGNGRNHHKDIVVMNLKDDLQVAEGLTPVKNLCLGGMNHFSRCGVIWPRFLRSLEREFSEWYGDDRVMKMTDSSILEKKDKMALMLYRMILKRPALLIVKFRGTNFSADINGLVQKGIMELTENGTSVCLLAASKETVIHFSDIYTLVTDEGTYRNIPFDRNEEAGEEGAYGGKNTKKP